MTATLMLLHAAVMADQTRRPATFISVMGREIWSSTTISMFIPALWRTSTATGSSTTLRSTVTGIRVICPSHWEMVTAHTNVTTVVTAVPGTPVVGDFNGDG